MKKRILDILQDIRPEFNFNDDVNFIEQGMLDSFDIVSLVTSLESEFGILIDGLDIIPENFESIRSIILLLEKNGLKS